MIAFDIDGVVANSQDVIRKKILKKHNYDIINNTKYDITIPNMERDDTRYYINKILLEYWYETKPYLEAPLYLEKFYNDMREPLIFITARERNLEYTTRCWLDIKINLPYEVYFVPSKEKHNFIKNNGINYFVEDKHETAVNCVNNGIECFLVNRYWNENEENHPNIVRVNGLDDVYYHWKILKNINL